MSKYPPKHPVEPPRLFANKYKLSRQLSCPGNGDLWLGEKNSRAYWVYYIPLSNPQANQHWEKWQFQLEQLKGKVKNQSLIFPTETQKEKDHAVIAFPAPNGNSLVQKTKPLTELELAFLIRDISQSLIDTEGQQHQLMISPTNMYRADEDRFVIFGWGLRHLSKVLSGDAPFDASAYFAPEHFDSMQKNGPESAVFSLGVSLFELATGKLPFGSQGGERLANVNVTIPELPQYSERFNHILQLMLARKADRRPSADTLSRLADTFIKEQNWKSVGGLSFSPSLSGKAPLLEAEVVKQAKISKKPAKLEAKSVRSDGVKRSPKEVIEKKSFSKKKLWLGLIPLSFFIVIGVWFANAESETAVVPSKIQTKYLAPEDDLVQLMNSRQRFQKLIASMVSNPNLPPTEQTFLRLAQMQLKNLDMEMEDYLLVRDDNTANWKGDEAYNWLHSTQSQLDRNIQNLELIR